MKLLVTGGATPAAAAAEVDASVDRLVHHAGWTDKLGAVLGSTNPVSAPYFSYSAPEPTGVVGVLAAAGGWWWVRALVRRADQVA